MTISSVVRAGVAERLANLNDAELLVRVRRREPEAFRVLYERHRDAVSRYARQWARGPAEARDFVAETFIRVLALLQDGKGPKQAFRPYAFTVVRNVAADHDRDEVVAGHPGNTDQPDQPDQPAERIERDGIHRAFDDLPARWQRVLWLAEVEGCGPADMAAVLGVSDTAAAALATRAREGLRQAYVLGHLGTATPDGCRRTVERLPAYVRTALPPASAQQVNDHLDECASCRARSGEITELDGNLRELLVPLLLGGAVADAPGADGPRADGPGALSGLAALLSTLWRRLRDLVWNPVGAFAAISLVIVVAGGLVSLAVRPTVHESAPPAAAGSPPTASEAASPSAPPLTRSPGGPTATPPEAGRQSHPSARPEHSAMAAVADRDRPTPPSPPAAEPSPPRSPSPSPTPSAACVTVLILPICGGRS
ncbi:MAG TPA: sigma-70 family RNA polymerase sigma factor [Streptosporangiaceae bacterium]